MPDNMPSETPAADRARSTDIANPPTIQTTFNAPPMSAMSASSARNRRCFSLGPQALISPAVTATPVTTTTPAFGVTFLPEKQRLDGLQKKLKQLAEDTEAAHNETRDILQRMRQVKIDAMNAEEDSKFEQAKREAETQWRARKEKRNKTIMAEFSKECRERGLQRRA